MLKKKITILILCLAVMTVVSGCKKKQVVEPFPYDNSANEILQIKKDPPIIKDINTNDIKDQKNQKQEIEKTATLTEEFLDTKIIEYNIDTSDWQIYKNEEYGYEIKYPMDWMVKENYYWHDAFEQYVKNVQFYNADKYYLLFAIAKKNEDIELVGRTGIAGGPPVKTGKKINIGNTKVEIINLLGDKEMTQEIFYSKLNTKSSPYGYFEIKNDYIAHATFSSRNAYSDNFDLKNKKEVQIAEEILKSFKFAD